MTDGWVAGIQNSRGLTTHLSRDYTTQFMLGIILPSGIGIGWDVWVFSSGGSTPIREVFLEGKDYNRPSLQISDCHSFSV